MQLFDDIFKLAHMGWSAIWGEIANATGGIFVAHTLYIEITPVQWLNKILLKIDFHGYWAYGWSGNFFLRSASSTVQEIVIIMISTLGALHRARV